MKKSIIPSILFISAILIVAVLSLVTFHGPKPKPGTSDLNEFSAERAFIHTQQIAQKPHSIGTQEQVKVKQYIIDQLLSLGLDTMMHKTTTFYDEHSVHAGYVENIIGILRGSEGEKAVMFVGHYDSQPNTLGAADDGVALASMLELARALKENKLLKNDVIFLFTDGEEAGLFGAKAFVEDKILVDKVGVIMNIEARGTSGVSTTYEVSPENGWIMREYKKCVPKPYATSIAYEISRLLPNDSDFTMFREGGFSGFNNAFIDEFVNYHSMTDSPENLDLRSMQHHGSYMINIAKHFGNLDLTVTKSKDVVFFNIIGNWMILYPMGLNIFLEILIVLLFAFYIFLGLKYKQLKIFKILIGSALFLVTTAITIFILSFLLKWILNHYPHYNVFYSANFYNINSYQLAFTSLSIAFFSVIYSFFIKWLKIENLITGVLILLFLLMVVMQIYLPSAPYLMIVPLLLLLIGGIISFQFNFNFEKNTRKMYLLYFFLLLPIITMFVPFIKLLYVTFGLKGILSGAGPVCLILGFLLFVIMAFYKINRWLLPTLSIIIGFIGLIIAHNTSEISKDQPLQSNVMYCMNADDSSAVWVSSYLNTDDWNIQFFENAEQRALTEYYPQATRTRLVNNAPVRNLENPQLTILSDTVIENSRIVELNISSPRYAEHCNIFIHSKSNLDKLIINDKKVTNEEFYSEPISEYHLIEYHGLHDRGVNITIKCDTVPIELFVLDKKLGLPFGIEYTPMPAHIIPHTGWESRVAMIKKTFLF